MNKYLQFQDILQYIFLTFIDLKLIFYKFYFVLLQKMINKIIYFYFKKLEKKKNNNYKKKIFKKFTLLKM